MYAESDNENSPDIHLICKQKRKIMQGEREQKDFYPVLKTKKKNLASKSYTSVGLSECS